MIDFFPVTSQLITAHFSISQEDVSFILAYLFHSFNHERWRGVCRYTPPVVRPCSHALSSQPSSCLRVIRRCCLAWASAASLSTFWSSYCITSSTLAITPWVETKRCLLTVRSNLSTSPDFSNLQKMMEAVIGRKSIPHSVHIIANTNETRPMSERKSSSSPAAGSVGFTSGHHFTLSAMPSSVSNTISTYMTRPKMAIRRTASSHLRLAT